MNVSKKNKQHTFKAMLARGWGRVVIIKGKEVMAICPPNQKKPPKQTSGEDV